MLRIDAHQHFWNYDPLEHAWMTDDMYAVKKNFLSVDLEPLLEQNKIDGTVLVQVTQSPEETQALIKISESAHFIKGIVGWVDLLADDIFIKLDEYRKFPKVKGFRHILQLEEPGFMLQPAFLRGISALKEFGFTYDILIYPNHLSAALKLVEKFPEQLFVIDHLAKPLIKAGSITEWQKGITVIASCENVYCKISGMVTEADWKGWKYSDFTPYIDCIVNCFGMKRVMYGSDWPMCLVAASYKEVIKIAEDYFAPFPASDRQLFFGGNAQSFYHL